MTDTLKEVHVTREFDAPASVIYNAWTDPILVKEWWGPNGVTIPECEIDLTIGGRIYIVMLAGEAMGPFKGTRWPMEGEFTSIETDKHIAYAAKAWTEGQESETTIETTTDISFEEMDGKTTVTVNAAILKAGPGAQMAVQGMEYGFNQQMDKLAVYLKNYA